MWTNKGGDEKQRRRETREHTSSKDPCKLAINSSNIIDPIGTNIRITPDHLRIIIPIRTIWRLMVLKIALHSISLIIGHREDVREAAARVDDALCGLLGLCDGVAWCDLGCAYGGHIRTGTGETGVEDAVVCSRAGIVACCWVDALSAIASDSVVA
jgi:hypothetical protein